MNQFTTLTIDECEDISGGFLLSATLFTVFGVAITGNMCLVAGGTVGLAAGTVVLDHLLD